MKMKQKYTPVFTLAGYWQPAVLSGGLSHDSLCRKWLPHSHCIIIKMHYNTAVLSVHLPHHTGVIIRAGG